MGESCRWPWLAMKSMARMEKRQEWCGSIRRAVGCDDVGWRALRHVVHSRAVPPGLPPRVRPPLRIPPLPPSSSAWHVKEGQEGR